jgi:hypothetical protein
MSLLAPHPTGISPSQHNRPYPSLPATAVRPLSEINFLSLLWLAFTVIELADMGITRLAPCQHVVDEAEDQEISIECKAPLGRRTKSVLFLCRTEIELALGLVFTGAWVGESFEIDLWREGGGGRGAGCGSPCGKPHRFLP